MFSWKVLWSTVLILTVVPEFALEKASMYALTAPLGTGSDWLEPTVTVPDTAPVGTPEPPELSELHAARPPAPSRAPTPRAPRSRVRRSTPRTEGGTMRARYSASLVGRVIAVSFDAEPGSLSGRGDRANIGHQKPSTTNA